MEQLQLNGWTLTWLRGGVTYLDGGAMFGVVPKALWHKKYPANDKNQIELRCDPILLQTGTQNILIDAGLGNGRYTEKQLRNYGISEQSYIEDDLHSIGLTTKDIDIVLMTHMHFDHVGGLAKVIDGNLVPTFEHADIVVNEIEWNEMKNPNIRSKNTYWEQNWKPIEEKVTTFKGEHEVMPGVKMIHTGGHSAGHSIVMIENGEQKIIHMADIMPTHAHNHVLWVLAYDDYPMKSIEQKQIWMEGGMAQEVWFTFYHDACYRAVQWDTSKQMIDSVVRERK
ncbi:YtnP family quorum-quenching lactonase [Bacillus alkalicellulosilyticus]|uniref:YtnP family quorum-quenching lactonase n=1 Tax=Alkalihalobacterium alkalicellulosilyticum TaxID=1912214 RepID=UPI000998A699|nr:MBL fold metallo-hydrolase [Bacillus alkalicellulosilyticus]